MNVQTLETELRVMAEHLTLPREGECLVCHVYRMLEFGCTGARWITRFRDLRAPRATALLDRLMSRGACCDCEMLYNAYELRERFRTRPTHALIYDPAYPDDPPMIEEEDPGSPDPMPACLTVRRGSTQPCGLWQRRYL